MRKVVGGFGKKSCVSTGVRKPGNVCVTDHHDRTLAVKVALNPNTTMEKEKMLGTYYGITHGRRVGGGRPVLCPEHISKTILATVMKFCGWIDLIKVECSAHYP